LGAKRAGALDGAPPDVQARFEERLAGEGLGPTEAGASVADDSADLDTWNLAEAIIRSSISPQVMDRFERLTAAQASRYSSSPPAEMWPVVRRELARADQALQQRQSLHIQRRLVAAVGRSPVMRPAAMTSPPGQSPCRALTRTSTASQGLLGRDHHPVSPPVRSLALDSWLLGTRVTRAG
jgi:hypothetical protein